MKVDSSYKLQTHSRSCSGSGFSLSERHRKLGHESLSTSTRRNKSLSGSNLVLTSKPGKNVTMFGATSSMRHALTSPRHRRHTIASSSLSSPSPCSLEYLARLRCEAFRELERQTQAYNDQMVAKMRFVESLSPEDQRAWFAKLARAERFADKDTDPEIDELVKTMADGVRVTDYSPLLEWEIGQKSSTDSLTTTSSDQWEFGYGDLW
ncbi:hypothetical protein BC937DRAFT_95507 [Endogone sp. FLAS-F59071]|nr:hypothetical protein BC937DRAFT_95507 [Endogone sp. FLAS-F59071]|eukprot:RUS20309.1 hypothetical protein BC937DRAFT_95507 [Endogone sp. FLAS-F59071]